MRARVKSGGLPLSRWETRFIQTYDRDALKLIPFALIILIAEELIPLVVMYAPFILPSTCILPAQKERIDRKKRAKQQAHVENMKNVYNDVYERALANPAADIKSILDAQGQVALCGLLGHSRFGLPALRLMRIRQDLTFVAKDDALLLREERGARLTDAELREALEERGILTDDLTPKQWQSRLEWWLTNVDMAGSNADPVNQRILLLARSATGRF
ncbi:hypothetical protein EW026_g3465 [Hermanssonia centrifuga]|uniref:Letm1 RBD domain-containing protein n=1 Tax=Hermanssonia centrifuga TaxID=98765 RepID=A0A4S4KK31_9APHY|nr:hypothetical protein EW026_g3465 [Hermanssonia centrifuga]